MKKLDEQTTKLILAAILAITAVVLMAMATSALVRIAVTNANLKEKELERQAVIDCTKASYRNKDWFNNEVYKRCKKDTGISSAGR